MKKIALLTVLFITMNVFAQEKNISQINVSGEGKIKVIPDVAIISLGVENTGKNAAEVKIVNDEIVDKLLKYIKKNNIPSADFQTANVGLYKNYDYEKKKYNYIAKQEITVTIKDLTKYNEFMMGVTETGVTTIQGVKFKSSKIDFYQAEARKKAMLNAKQKALDYVSVINQKVGKALLISDNSESNHARPIYKNMAMATLDSSMEKPNETLAIGEIEIISNVQVAFVLE